MKKNGNKIKFIPYDSEQEYAYWIKNGNKTPRKIRSITQIKSKKNEY